MASIAAQPQPTRPLHSYTDTVTQIYDRLIDHPSVWTARSLGGKKEALVSRFSEDHLKAFDELLKATRQTAPTQVTRAQFDHPAINGWLADIFKLLRHGRGAVVISGLTPDRYSEEDLERIYWGCGTHWGNVTAVQSRHGDRLGHVRHEPGEEARGYRSTDELVFHTDAHEMVGLMCLHKAGVSGGYSRIASSMAIHNEIFNTRPDLLPALYRGYPILTTEQLHVKGSQVSHYRMPVFSNVDGVVSCNYVRLQFNHAARAQKASLPADLTEALDYFDALAQRPDIHMEFMLEPGEMVMFNNWTTLHARTSFVDGGPHPRHLLRLWLAVPDGRTVIRPLLERSASYNRVHEQVSKQ